MTTAGVQPFSVGGVFGQSFSILGQNLVPFGIIALVVTLPSFVYALITGTSAVTASIQSVNGTFYAGESFVGRGATAAFLLQMLLRYIAVGTISYGVFQQLRGERASLDDCISRALSVFFPVMGVAIVATLAIVLATILLVIPGLIVATMLWLAVPVAVVERPGVFASLSRSAVLTKGHRWQIFGIIMIIGIAGYAARLLIARLFGAVGGTLLVDLAQWLVLGGFAALSAVTVATGYSILRLEKDGIDIHALAQVFD